MLRVWKEIYMRQVALILKSAVVGLAALVASGLL